MNLYSRWKLKKKKKKTRENNILFETTYFILRKYMEAQANNTNHSCYLQNMHHIQWRGEKRRCKHVHLWDTYPAYLLVSVSRHASQWGRKSGVSLSTTSPAACCSPQVGPLVSHCPPCCCVSFLKLLPEVLSLSCVSQPVSLLSRGWLWNQEVWPLLCLYTWNIFQ